jgi:hypothetical protein
MAKEYSGVSYQHYEMKMRDQSLEGLDILGS